MKIDITLEEALRRASPTLRGKVGASVATLQKGCRLAALYNPDKGYHLAFSGGKDSQALFHIAQLADVPFHACFSPTTVDPPQVLRFIRQHYPEVEFLKPKKSIYQSCLERHGLLPTATVRWCCAEFKETRGVGEVTLTGVRKEESVKRSKRKEYEVTGHKFAGSADDFEDYRKARLDKMKHINQDQFADPKEQEVRCISGKDKIIVNPILEWTERDVWEFLNNVVRVPHCVLYDPPYNFRRVGCMFCPMCSLREKRQHERFFPQARAKWLSTIRKSLGDAAKRDAVITTEIAKRYPKGWSGGDYTEDMKDWISEEMFERWLSGKQRNEWIFNRYYQQKINFEEDEEGKTDY